METITLKNGTVIPVYFDEDNPPEVPDIRVVFSPEPFCEHCLALEPYDATIYADGTGWCESCACCTGNATLTALSEDEDAMKRLRIWEKQEKTAHFNARLRGLADDVRGFKVEDEDSNREDRFSDIEDRLDTLENDLADLSVRLKRIEDFLREEEMRRRQDVITVEPETMTPQNREPRANRLVTREVYRIVPPELEPEDEQKMVQTGPDKWEPKR